MFKKFNNFLALAVLAVIIPALWILHGGGIIRLPGEVLGATIAAFTLIVQYYFRKKEESTGGTPKT